jgi:hypothetical protein
MEIKKKKTEFSSRRTELSILDFQVLDTALSTHKKFEHTEIKFADTKSLSMHKSSFQALEARKIQNGKFRY